MIFFLKVYYTNEYKNKWLLGLLFLFCLKGYAQTDQTFYLIGDAGKDTNSNALLLKIKGLIEKDSNSTLVFLGDNIYPKGIELKEKKRKLSEKKLNNQLDILQNYPGNAFVIPGNHDWRQGRMRGLEAVKEEGVYVEKYLDNSATKNRTSQNFVPANGLPGPYTYVIDKKYRLIALDIQWWLHKQPFHPVGMMDDLTKKEMELQFFKNLDSLLALSKKNGERVLICAHHPLFSNGSHGRLKQPFRFLNNFTFLGILGGYRYFSQDIEQPRYKRIKKKLLQSFKPYENIFYVSGHDHTIQYHKHEKNHYFVSGAGSKYVKSNSKRYLNEFEYYDGLGAISITFLKDGTWSYQLIKP